MIEAIIDTNILLLYVVGSAGRLWISQHKRTRPYTVSDYDALVDLLRSVKSLIVTPHIIAECSNLLRQTREPLRTLVAEQLKFTIERVLEIHVPSIEAVKHGRFVALGLTDAGILSILTASRSLLTVDLDLYVAAVQSNYTAINSNHHLPAS